MYSRYSFSCAGFAPHTYRSCTTQLNVPHPVPQYGFNPGSNLAIHSYVLAERVTRTAVVTTLGAGSGAIGAMALAWHRTRTWDLLQVRATSYKSLPIIQ